MSNETRKSNKNRKSVLDNALVVRKITPHIIDERDSNLASTYKREQLKQFVTAITGTQEGGEQIDLPQIKVEIRALMEGKVTYSKIWKIEIYSLCSRGVRE